MSWLKDKIKAANAVGENEITLQPKEWSTVHNSLGNQDSDDAEYLVTQMDAYKDTKIIPLHLAQHIYEQLESQP